MYKIAIVYIYPEIVLRIFSENLNCISVDISGFRCSTLQKHENYGHINAILNAWSFAEYSILYHHT